jgi:predicted nucleic acid-binding protein
LIPEAIADTSAFVAVEQGRPLRDQPPERIVVSCVTIAELHAGVLGASTPAEQAVRSLTLRRAQTIEPLPADVLVAFAWADLRQALKEAKRNLDENDSWIAATAIAHRLPLATQDRDFLGVPGLRLIQL